MTAVVIVSLYYYSPSYVLQANKNLFITHGIASGDVTDHSAVVWSRVNREAQMHVEYDTTPNFLNPRFQTAFANQTTDFTAHVKRKT